MFNHKMTCYTILYLRINGKYSFSKLKMRLKQNTLKTINRSNKQNNSLSMLKRIMYNKFRLLNFTKYVLNKA